MMFLSVSVLSVCLSCLAFQLDSQSVRLSIYFVVVAAKTVGKNCVSGPTSDHKIEVDCDDDDDDDVECCRNVVKIS